MNKMSTKMEIKSSQQALLSDKGIVDNSQLNLVNKVLPPKWFTKIKIVISHDYHSTVIVMTDSSADMNYIQEGLIPSKYFKKSTERLVSANGTQMKIKFEFYFLSKRISSNSIMFNKKGIQSVYKWQTKNHFISHVFNQNRKNLKTDMIMTNMSIIQFKFNFHLSTISRNQSFS